MKSLDDLKGKTIAVNKGSAYETWARDNAAKYGFKYDVYATNADALQAVQSGLLTQTWPATQSRPGLPSRIPQSR